jgi:SAM-dependent methyltransferase
VRHGARVRHFERLYASSDDPWNYRGSAYEHAKYADTLRHLPRARYRRAVEVGCAIGVLTDQLAARAERVLGIDPATRAIRLARAGRRRSNVDFRVGRVPPDWPAGAFDLCVLSEVLYYLSPAERRRLALRLVRQPAADVVLVNWRGETGTPWSGADAADDVAARLRAHGFAATTTERPGYRIDVLRRVSGAGTATGLSRWEDGCG